MKTVKATKLDIHFHNPNTTDEFLDELVKVCALVVHQSVKVKLLHIPFVQRLTIGVLDLKEKSQ